MHLVNPRYVAGGTCRYIDAIAAIYADLAVLLTTLVAHSSLSLSLSVSVCVWMGRAPGAGGGG